MPTDDRSKRINTLESARRLSLGGSYEAALQEIDQLLETGRADLEALRLKGNILELKALDANEQSSKKLMTSADYLEARKCYEEILVKDPSNTMALTDLGDHFKNLGAYDKAFDYYAQAWNFLKRSEGQAAWLDEVEELGQRVSELHSTKPDFEAALALSLECQGVLDSRNAG